MALNPTAKVLASGQLAAAIATLYTVPANTSTIIKSISYVNTSTTTTRTVNLLIRTDGANDRNVIPPSMPLGPKESMRDGTAWSLETGDLIRGYADAATTVDYVITGAEEDTT